MDRFLAGFADELIKVAAPGAWGAPAGAPATPRPPNAGIVRPPSTGVPGAPVPKPPNQMGAPGGAVLGAIPTQVMQSPAKAAPQGWRPSPGYRPDKAGDPKATPTPPKQGGGKRGPGVDNGPAWESAPQRASRLISERTSQRGFAADKARSGRSVGVDGTAVKQTNQPVYTSSKSYTLTPEQLAARKQQRPADGNAPGAFDPRKAQAPAPRTTAQVATATKKIDRASANSALAGGGRGQRSQGGPTRQR